MSKKPPPLLGYNTNVRHHGNLFHIQTEDSGVDHPHIITHLFVEGTILATKKSTYEEVLWKEGWESTVREMMKDQHRAIFIELRDGVHDELAARIFGNQVPSKEAGKAVEPPDDSSLEKETTLVDIEDQIREGRRSVPPESSGGVRVIRPADMSQDKSKVAASADVPKTISSSRYRSVFDTPDDDGEFGENLITDKSLDEVILSYLTDELEEE